MTPETLEAIFVQREEQARRIEELVIRAVSGGERTHFLLYGPRGIGKTHLISLLYHRLQARPELAEKMRIAWLREEERGVTSITEMLLRVLKSLQKAYPKELTEAMLAALYEAGDISAIENAAKRLLAQFACGNTLLLIAENLDDIFNGLGKTGQGKLRAWIENTDNIVLLAATPSMKAGAQDPVKKIAGSHSTPFYGFFRQELLADFSLDEAVALLQKIAKIKGDTEQERYLKTEEGRNRVQAVHHLAGGNPRVYVILAQFLVATNLDDLTQPFLKMLDDMTPYYQSRLATLSPQQNQIIEFLCQYRAAVTVSEIAKQCLMTAQTASSQLKTLKEIGYVRSDTAGRESYYELREPLMRLSLEVKESRGGPIPLLVDFLRLWFSRKERKTILANLSPDKNPVACMYFREALSFTHTTYLPQAMYKSVSSERKRVLELIEAGQWEAALFATEEILEKQDENLDARTWSVLGYIQDELNRDDEALESFNTAVQIAPKDAKLWNHRGAVLNNLGRDEEALESFDRAVQIDPEHSQSWNNRGSTLDRLGCYQEALTSFDRAVQIAPEYFQAWSNRGSVLDHLNLHEEALVSFDRAMEIAPNYAQLWYNRGVALDNLGRHEEALTSLDVAVQIDPEHAQAWNNREHYLIIFVFMKRH
jgi:tetratricopeptide (TPR) repeat protein